MFSYLPLSFARRHQRLKVTGLAQDDSRERMWLTLAPRGRSASQDDRVRVRRTGEHRTPVAIVLYSFVAIGGGVVVAGAVP